MVNMFFQVEEVEGLIMVFMFMCFCLYFLILWSCFSRWRRWRARWWWRRTRGICWGGGGHPQCYRWTTTSASLFGLDLNFRFNQLSLCFKLARWGGGERGGGRDGGDWRRSRRPHSCWDSQVCSSAQGHCAHWQSHCASSLSHHMH